MIIVTGAAGFIGSAVVWGLNLRGLDDILLVDELDTSDKWKNLRGLRFADYLDKDRLRDAVQRNQLPAGIQAIIHLGASSATTETDARLLLDNNFAYTRLLAEHAVRHNIRFVYASSAATYGDGSAGYDDDENRLDALRPLNMYGYSKHLFDLWARRTGLLRHVAGLKYSNVFGPNEYHKAAMRSVVLQAYEQIRDSGAVRLFKSYRPEYAHGCQMRDFLYVKDAVAMTLFFLDCPAAGLFNVGAGRARPWNDLAHAAFAALDRSPRIEYIEMPESLRPQYQYFTELNMDKLHAAGYQRPPATLEHAVADYLRHYLVPGKYLDALEPGEIPLA